MTKTLECWVDDNYSTLGKDIKISINCLTDLDDSEQEDLWRCIMISIRQEMG